MEKAYVFLADGFEEIEGLTVVDILRRAGADTQTVSVMGRKEITGSHRITLQQTNQLQTHLINIQDLILDRSDQR